MIVSLIAAVADGNVLGLAGELPWYVPPDLKRFKALTWGHHVLMGRRTWDSIGHRPLPGRTTIVVSRAPQELPPGARSAGSLEEGLALARAAGETEAFVAGGGEIYRLALPLADRIHLTRIAVRVDGDTFFPELDEKDFRLVAREDHEADGATPAFSFLTYERV